MLSLSTLTPCRGLLPGHVEAIVLNRFSVSGFKSLEDVENFELDRLTVIFGPNAVGKSNLLDALQVYSKLATSDTAADALTPPVRGLPLETLTFPPEGLPRIISDARNRDAVKRSFRLDGEISSASVRFRYLVEVAIAPLSGAVTIENEVLQRLSRRGVPQGRAVIETEGRVVTIRRKSKPGHPWSEEAGANHTILSNRRYSGKEYALMDAARQELSSFRSYYLDPRLAMRAAQPPQEVDDIGVNGEHVAPFLYRLRAERPKVFDSVKRTLRSVIPSVEELTIELDTRRGVLDIEITQNGTPFSSRIVSEGTLRVLGLICVAVNPWSGTLLAFEEPENGVHPRRVELIAQLLASVVEAASGKQVVVTTHSPILCSVLLRMARNGYDGIRLYQAVQRGSRSEFRRLDTAGPLFDDSAIQQGLKSGDDEQVFEELLLRGFFDVA